MLIEDAEQVLKHLEDRAREAFLISEGVESGLTAAIRLSIAISLKRLADAFARPTHRIET